MERIVGNLDIMFATGKRSLGMDFDFASFVFLSHRRSGAAGHTVALEQHGTPSQRSNPTHRRSGAAGHTVAAVQSGTPSQRSCTAHRHSGTARHAVTAEQSGTPSQRSSRTHRRSGAEWHTVAASSRTHRRIGAARHIVAAVQHGTSRATVASLKNTESRKIEQNSRLFLYFKNYLLPLCFELILFINRNITIL